MAQSGLTATGTDGEATSPRKQSQQSSRKVATPKAAPKEETKASIETAEGGEDAAKKTGTSPEIEKAKKKLAEESDEELE